MGANQLVDVNFNGSSRWRRPTARELEVLDLMAGGFSTREIASRLGIAHGTAAYHRNRLLQRANAPNTATLVQLAIRWGWITA